MAKNIPITARVGKGLFGQKVSEPVLNVGQAGVSGNNATRNIPSPAKQVSADSAGKRLLKEGQANVTFGSNEPDTVVKGETKTIPGKTYVPRETAAWKAKYNTPEKKAAYNKKKRAEIANNPEYQSKTVQEPDKLVKGKENEQTEGINVFNTGSAKTSFWRRQDERGIAHSARKTKRSEIQLAKAQADIGYYKDEKGNKINITDKKSHISNAKKEAKVDQAEAKVAGYKGVRNAAVKQGQQSTRVHGEIKGTYVDPKGQQALEIADAKVGKQEEYELKAKMAAKKNKVDNKSTTNNPAATNNKPEMSQTKSTEVKKAENSGVSTVTEKEKEDDKPMVESTAKKSANGFFGKKSPLKMKYFK